MFRFFATLALALCLAPAAAQKPAAIGAFEPVGDLLAARNHHTATLLADGRVLIAGGSDGTGAAHASVEIYDPASRSFSFAGMLQSARYAHSATLLPDGRVLIAGGYGADRTAQTSAEWFDPASGTSIAAGDLGAAQIGHSATLLRDGRVLIAGGLDLGRWPDVAAAAAELFDPASGRFARTAGYAVGNSLYPPGAGPIWPRAVLLRDGSVLLTGNAVAERFDPASGSFRAAGAMRGAAYRFGMWGHAATLLHDGTVLVTGGNDEWSRLDGAERYDPATDAFSTLPAMGDPRAAHSATLLPDGRVLIAGGETQVASAQGRIAFGGSLASTEYYEPAVQAFTRGPAMRHARTGHTATLLLDGSVLIAGGVDYAAFGSGHDPRVLQSAERHVASGMCAKRYPNRCAATK